ncbi:MULTISPECIES: AvrD family protein [Sphingobacterium]|uniref:AvrD family protein n=1 Tax=Sphingobacterium TaxID=28453 RepID=UPI0013DB9097|nr:MULTISPECIES: AvrD family protein [unclassified Sphingobacterium]
METTKKTKRTATERLLGNTDERYFGEGFKYFNSKIVDFKAEDSKITGKIKCGYYGPQRPRDEAPHLGSIEYLSLALRIASYGLNRLGRHKLQILNYSFLCQYTLTISTTLEMGTYPFTCRLLHSKWDDNCMQGRISTFEINIGKNRIIIGVDHGGGGRIIDLPSQETLPLDMENMHSLGYKHTELLIDNIKYRLAKKQIGCDIQYKQLTTEGTMQGIGSSRESLLSTDATRVFGQLMQILAYKLNKSDRIQCPNIWLRKMSLNLERQHFSGTTEGTLTFDQVREVKQGDKHWNLISLSGKVGNYEGKFEVAFQVTSDQ